MTVPVAPADTRGVRSLIQLALAEDVGSGDLTTRATVARETRARGRVIAREDMVVAGMGLLEAIIEELSGMGEAGSGAPSLRVSERAGDGVAVSAGNTLCARATQARSCKKRARSASYVWHRWVFDA